MDLWISRAVIGRWMDDEGRVFSLSRLDIAPPPVEINGAETRTAYGMTEVKIGKDDLKPLRHAIGNLSPVELAEKPLAPRQAVRGYDDVDYWQGTNATALVCAFLPEKGRWWYLAVWELVDGDDIGESAKTFESRFLAAEPDGSADGLRAMEWKRKGFWRDAAKRNGVDIDCSGVPCLAHFGFKENKLELKTLYTVLMLKEGFLGNTAIYPTLAHTDEVLALHREVIDKVFFQMGEIIRKGGREAILEAIGGPVCLSGFKRLLD
jgi:hypothetical protein